VSDLLASIGWTDRLSARVFLDGELVRDAAWEYTLPTAGQSLVVRAIPTGGGENGKSALRIVAMIAIIAAAVAIGGAPAFAAGGALAGWGGVASAAISIAGTLAVSSVIPPPLPRRALPREEHRPVAA
jgi:O-antigen/teichoic acid export membrane protein